MPSRLLRGGGGGFRQRTALSWSAVRSLAFRLLSSTVGTVTAVSVANSIATVSFTGSPLPTFSAGQVVVLANTAEGNVNNPSTTA